MAKATTTIRSDRCKGCSGTAVHKKPHDGSHQYKEQNRSSGEFKKRPNLYHQKIVQNPRPLVVKSNGGTKPLSRVSPHHGGIGVG